MHEERMLILEMLAEGKISVEDAERLLAALEEAGEAEAIDEEDVEDEPMPHFHYAWSFDEPMGEAMKMACGTVEAMFNAWGSFRNKKNTDDDWSFSKKV